METNRYDLHMHSMCSDGTDTVDELVRKVKIRGLAGFAITDHDAITAHREASELAFELDLEYITGVELSLADGNRDLHLLVYGFDPYHEEFRTSLESFRQVRKDRMYSMALKLAELGMAVDVEFVARSPEASALGRPHLARLLVENGAVRSIREAFDRYLAVGKPAYVPKAALSPEAGIELARRAGGVTVLAHPGSYPFEPDLAPLVEAGLQGLETTYPMWDRVTTAYWRKQAARYGLLESGGSDYHGHHRGGVQVGDATIDEPTLRRLLTASSH